ncbi:hypothetical protein ACFPVY_03930 [Flavobacterium qiangtangense]|uniref:Uncharacterized protein n=1 Tax=Flavobacterium qiangtangense TaxID=1442595 RepID=A0ABW1PJI0_9FLAO
MDNNLKAKIKRIQKKCPYGECIFYNGYIIINYQIGDVPYDCMVYSMDDYYTVEYFGQHPNGKAWYYYSRWDAWDLDKESYDLWNQVPGFEKAFEQYQHWYGVKINLV